MSPLPCCVVARYVGIYDRFVHKCSRGLVVRCLLCCRYVDTDVVVAEVRETSRKPDEMYPLLERLSPGGRGFVICRAGGWVRLGFKTHLLLERLSPGGMGGGG